MKFVACLFLMISTVFSGDFPQSNQEVTIRRIENGKDFEPHVQALKEINRLEDYLYTSEVPISPFGTYILFVSTIPAGIIHVSEFNESGTVAEVMTDVIKSYQGRGFGTLIRKHLADEVSRESKDVRFIKSVNEWSWGENLESLKSSIRAGFKIYSFYQYSGFLSLFYSTKNEHTQEAWPEERTTALVAIGNIIRNLKEYNLSDQEIRDQLKNNFKNILLSLNLSLAVDQRTLSILAEKVMSAYEGQSLNWSDMFGDVLRSYIERDASSAFRESSDPQEMADILKIPDKSAHIKEILGSNDLTTQDKIRKICSN